MTEVILEAKDVRKTFHISAGAFRAKRPLHAVNGVSLKIYRGEVLGLVGESGCGKTTLAKMLLGLLQPSSGGILIGGEPVGEAHRLHTARMIQPVFQDPYSSLNPRKTVGAIITLPLKVQNAPDPENWRKRVEDILDIVGLPKRVYGNYPNQLSGGQRQRVAVARALVFEPPVLLMDEPLGALDKKLREQMQIELKQLHERIGVTIIYVTHDQEEALTMSDRVVILDRGRIIQAGRPTALYLRPDGRTG